VFLNDRIVTGHQQLVGEYSEMIRSELGKRWFLFRLGEVTRHIGEEEEVCLDDFQLLVHLVCPSFPPNLISLSTRSLQKQSFSPERYIFGELLNAFSTEFLYPGELLYKVRSLFEILDFLRIVRRRFRENKQKGGELGRRSGFELWIKRIMGKRGGEGMVNAGDDHEEEEEESKEDDGEEKKKRRSLEEEDIMTNLPSSTLLHFLDMACSSPSCSDICPPYHVLEGVVGGGEERTLSYLHFLKLFTQSGLSSPLLNNPPSDPQQSDTISDDFDPTPAPTHPTTRVSPPKTKQAKKRRRKSSH